MAPPIKSRKGKKAWRKNIDASEVEAFVEEQTYQERRGPAAKELKDDQLFFVDTTADIDAAAAAADGRRPAKRRREEVTAKPLRSQQIIAEAHKAKPLAMAPPPRKPSVAATAGKAKGALVPATVGALANGWQRDPDGLQLLDIWGDDDLGLSPAVAGSRLQQHRAEREVGREEGAQQGSKNKSRKVPAVEDRTAAAAAVVRAMGPTAKPLRKSPPPVRVAAVAVDIPGCSFNPDVEQHQDALALLVATEMKKELQKELQPAAPPREVDVPEGAPALSQLEMLQVEAADSDEDGEDDADREACGCTVAAAAAASDPNAIVLATEDVDGGGKGGSGKLKAAEKKSRKERNKEARRKAAEAEAEERRRIKAQRRELQSLQDVTTQLEEEEAEKELKRLRKAAMLEERAAVLPPRLGKTKFEPPSVQVLTSDEKTGSLRQVVPCAMLAAERFKSLQQRGLVEPRKPQAFKEKRRKVMYEKGSRFERASAASTEVREMTRHNKKKRRQAKASANGSGREDEWM